MLRQCVQHGFGLSWVDNKGLLTIVKHPDVVVGKGGQR